MVPIRIQMKITAKTDNQKRKNQKHQEIQIVSVLFSHLESKSFQLFRFYFFIFRTKI